MSCCLLSHDSTCQSQHNTWTTTAVQQSTASLLSYLYRQQWGVTAVPVRRITCYCCIALVSISAVSCFWHAAEYSLRMHSEICHLLGWFLRSNLESPQCVALYFIHMYIYTEYMSWWVSSTASFAKKYRNTAATLFALYFPTKYICIRVWYRLYTAVIQQYFKLFYFFRSKGRGDILRHTLSRYIEVGLEQTHSSHAGFSSSFSSLGERGNCAWVIHYIF